MPQQMEVIEFVYQQGNGEDAYVTSSKKKSPISSKEDVKQFFLGVSITADYY